MTAFSQSKELQQCSLPSIFAAVMLSSQVGLEIGVQGQAYLVPYRGECTFMPGWKGLVDLFNRTGKGTVWTGAVFQGDEFDWALGDRPFVSHKPSGEDNLDLLTHVYAVGRLNGTEWPVIDVWPVMKCQRHRDRNNKVGKKHYSYGNWEMYCRKLPLLQVLKYLPASVELSQALAADAAAETGQTYDLSSGDFQTVDNEPEAPEQEEAPKAEREVPKESQEKPAKKEEAKGGDWE